MNTRGANAFMAGSTTDITEVTYRTEILHGMGFPAVHGSTVQTAACIYPVYINEVSKCSTARTWNHSQDLNPDAFKIIKTDRDNIVTVSNDVIVESRP